jgi:hypothetical protein
MPEILLSILGVIGHVLLAVLKVILIILLVVLILILLLLFTPFTYRADVHRHEGKFYGSAGLSWLGFVLRLRARFGDGADRVELYLFGVPLLKLIRRIRERKNGGMQKREPYSGAKKKPTVPPGGNRAENGERPAKEIRPEIKGGSDSRSKIKSIYDKIKYVIDLLRSEEYKKAFDVIKTRGLKLVRHIAPKKIDGTVEFGFDDPSYTGQALGVLAWILPAIPDGLRVIPDFTEKKLEADVRAKGYFFVILLLKEGLGIVFNQDVKKMIHAVRHGQSSS